MRTTKLSTTCSLDDGGHCRFYRPGHAMHHIQARLIGQSPWGWRDAVVVMVEGLFLTLRYLIEDVEFTAWHHDALGLAPGDPVRVNQSYGTVLQGTFGQVTIAHNSPLPAIPEPEHPELWAAESSWGVVDLATGRAVNLNDEFDGNTP